MNRALVIAVILLVLGGLILWMLCTFPAVLQQLLDHKLTTHRVLFRKSEGDAGKATGGGRVMRLTGEALRPMIVVFDGSAIGRTRDTRGVKMGV